VAYYPRSMPASRRFLPPWSVEETDACFIVRDKNGQALAYGDAPGLVIGEQVRR
jgi:hypothetical protein